MLKIYNSLTREKQTFVPIEPGRVRMYVCGMTVYDYCHLGHARVMVAFDVARCWLRALGYQVTYVRNITDIDDKIIKRAQENGETVAALTARFIQAMDEDNAVLGVEKPDFEPRATDYVSGMQEMIGMLERRGLAYRAANGDVNYSVRKFPGYGKLSGKSLDDLRAGERVEVDAAKQDPLDFVLWKRAKESEPFWESAWGRGRPGWHIECSVMSSALLGKHFDIHGGGQDLQFPHHENEIAQSEGANQETFVNYWMHNGFVRVDNEKMSKSIGNFFTVREVRAKYDPEVIRFFIIRAHYRSPINYSDQTLDEAKQALTRLYTALKGFEVEAGSVDWDNPYAARFRDAMNDDFNTPEAIAVLFELASEVNRTHRPEDARLLKSLGRILGLLQRDPTDYLQGRTMAIAPPTGQLHIAGDAPAISVGYSPERIKRLIVERSAARKSKNFAEADRIRKELLDAGIILEDGPQGTTWRRN
ncbi:MAG: cysteine--tRNA ligase [Betaproteobacteria bacterium]|nr:cysteine--tRNA ligase [Betaproteobacteria bacterium]MDH3437125.1 cysteine--tRNA ligase [Betaproteobacteria bacterium]